MMINRRTVTALAVVVGAWVALAGFWKPVRSMQEEAPINSLKELDEFFPPAQVCGSCHGRAHEEWQKSYHASALVDIATGFKKYISQVEAREGRFPNKQELLACFDCHVPALKFAAEPVVQQVARWVVEGNRPEMTRFNVGCAFCHTGAVTGRPEKNVVHGSIESAYQPEGIHRSQFAPKMRKADFCATCHQAYESPVAKVFCSLVFESWQKSPVRETKQCQDCHMKASDGVASDYPGSPTRVVHTHRFQGGHSAEMLQEALQLALEVGKPATSLPVEVRITNLAGHRLPDG
ncbi:MAG: hypothetical protein HY652_08775 [Acidobacteria bacterium]|nr:hypothetical protein [Acidobacteriota bacterium]